MSDDFINAWPSDVLNQAISRNLILIVGSGVSSSCERNGKRPPSWDRLLLDLMSKLGVQRVEEEVLQLVSNSRLLDAAELLKQESKQLGREQDFFKYICEAVDGGVRSQYLGSDWHHAIAGIEPDVIVTTNYDKILERATMGGFESLRYHDFGIAAQVRRKTPIILKLHGSVGVPEKMVITRTDYSRLRLEGAESLEVIQALLLTRTALLVGYSLRDPDLQLLFENIFGARDITPPHYILIQDSLPGYERDVLRFSYGVNSITYPTGDHDAALRKLQLLARSVQDSATLV